MRNLQAIRTSHFTRHPASIAGDRVDSFSVMVELFLRDAGAILPCKWCFISEIYSV